MLKYGKLGITKHTGVMSALEKRALRYRRGACREDEYDKARELMEGMVSRRFQRQGPDIANQVRILKSRD